jgi:hypothetical protein
MRTTLIYASGLAALGFLAGCATLPPGAEPGPHGTMAYYVKVEASEPGVRIQANGEDVGTAPLTLKIFGDTDGTFHDFGSYYYVVQALPLHTNQYVQTRYFRTGRHFSGEDYIPKSIYFDMNQPPAPAPAYAVPQYYGGPGPYYGPWYGPPPYFGPGPVFWGPRIFIGPGGGPHGPPPH